MKRLFLLLIIALITNQSYAQTENYTFAIESFQTNYNTDKYDMIFNSFSSKMQQALPLDVTRKFLVDLKSQFGKIENKEFIESHSGSFVNYRTQFEKALLLIKISLDDQNKINGLSITPYEEIKVNNAANALSIYPKKIADLIYSKAKYFPNNTQFSIGIISNSKINYYGIIIENDSVKPIDNKDKVFEIGSITKVFTSTVLASLVEENNLELTNCINDYYPFTFNDTTKITFKSLANHTSRLPRLPDNLDLSNEHNPYKGYSGEKLREYLENLLQLENDTTIVYSYSNIGAGLLGFTLGLSQEKSFQALLQSRVFEKYKMNNSFTSSLNLNHKLVKGLNNNGEVVPNWEFDALLGAGGILSTSEDMLKFAIGHFNPQNKELTLTRNTTFNVDENMKIGLGWHILKSKNDKELYWHNGGTGGYSSSIALSTENKNAVVILSNVSAFNPKMKNIDNLAFALMELLEDE